MAATLPTPPVLPELRSPDGTARLGVVTDATAEAIAALLAYAQALAASLATADAAQTEARETAVSGLQTQVTARAPLVSPALSGAPTAPTPTAGSAAGQIATKGYVDATAASAASGAVSGYATTAALTSGLSGKANTSHTHGVADLTATGTRNSSTFLRGDNTWAAPTTTVSVPGPYADDATAASSGVAVGGLYYRSGGAVYRRLA
jgi:hypothetical protein